MNSENKFRASLPVSAFFIRNSWLAVGVLVILGGALIPFSQSLGMAVILLSLSVVAASLEKSSTFLLIFAPMLAFCFRDTFGKGVAVILMSVAGSDTYDTVAMFKSLLSLTVFFVVFFAGYKLVRSRNNIADIPMENRHFQAEVLKPLAWFGAACFLYAVFGVLIQAISGSIDRGFVSEAKYYGTFGFDSLFRVFHRFSYVGFLLLPVVWKHGPVLFRFIIIPGFLFYLLIALASGGRGMMFFPLVFTAIGYFIFTKRRPLKYELIALALFPVFLFLMYVVDVYRQTGEFYESRLSDVSERLEAFGSVGDVMREKGSGVGDAVVKVSKRLYGDMDPIIYEMTPRVIGHAGFENFDSLLWIWIPQTFYPNQPFAADAVFIVQEYRYVFNKTHIGITLPSDLYRRFGWFGVPIGGVIFGALFAIFINIVTKIYNEKNALMGLILIALLITLFQDRIFTSVTGTIYSFGYHFLKHVLVAWVFVFAYRTWFKNCRGARAYMS